MRPYNNSENKRKQVCSYATRELELRFRFGRGQAFLFLCPRQLSGKTRARHITQLYLRWNDMSVVVVVVFARTRNKYTMTRNSSHQASLDDRARRANLQSTTYRHLLRISRIYCKQQVAARMVCLPGAPRSYLSTCMYHMCIYVLISTYALGARSSIY